MWWNVIIGGIRRKEYVSFSCKHDTRLTKLYRTIRIITHEVSSRSLFTQVSVSFTERCMASCRAGRSQSNLTEQTNIIKKTRIFCPDWRLMSSGAQNSSGLTSGIVNRLILVSLSSALQDNLDKAMDMGCSNVVPAKGSWRSASETTFRMQSKLETLESVTSWGVEPREANSIVLSLSLMRGVAESKLTKLLEVISKVLHKCQLYNIIVT